MELCNILRIRNFVELRPFAKYKEDCKEKNNKNWTKAFRDSTDTRVPADRQVQCVRVLFCNNQTTDFRGKHLNSVVNGGGQGKIPHPEIRQSPMSGLLGAGGQYTV